MALKGSWTNSRELTSKSWSVIKENKYMLGFPVLGFVGILIVFAILWLPAILLFAANQVVLGIILLVIGVFAVGAAIQISTAGLIAAADAELEGRDSSLGQGLGATISRLPVIIAWSIISSIVSMLLGLLRGNGEGGIVAVILRNVLAAAAGVMWQLITFFVLPIIMIEKLGPIAAIKRSSSLFKDRWGLQLSGGIRIGGLIGLATILPGVLLCVLGGFMIGAGGAVLVSLGAALFVVGVVLFAIGSVLINAMRAVFSVALYKFATNGQAVSVFSESELQGAVKTK